MKKLKVGSERRRTKAMICHIPFSKFEMRFLKVFFMIVDSDPPALTRIRGNTLYPAGTELDYIL